MVDPREEGKQEGENNVCCSYDIKNWFDLDMECKSIYFIIFPPLFGAIKNK